MKTYNSLTELWHGALENLLENEWLGSSSRDGDVAYELFGWSAMLTGNAVRNNFVVLNPRRAVDISYTCAELIWFLSGTPDPAAILPYAPSYTRWLVDGQAVGAYGPRAAYRLVQAVEHLRRRPNSRRAVVSVWQPADLSMAEQWPDVPCVLSWQLSIRDGELIWETVMRSNDVWLGMPHDLSVFCMLHRMCAESLGLKVGGHIHHVHSLHLYSRYVERAQEAVMAEALSLGESLAAVIAEDTLQPFPKSQEAWSQEVAMAVGHEASARAFWALSQSGLSKNNLIADVTQANILSAAVHAATACKWTNKLTPIASPVLETARHLPTLASNWNLRDVDC